MSTRACGRLSSTLVVLSLPFSSAAAGVHIVNPEGTGDFPTIQAAITAATTGDVIELVDGTYTGDGNRNLTFLGKAITVRSQSGSPEACIIDCEGSELDPHYGVGFTSGETSATVLEGITVTGGRLTGGACGGAALIRSGASPTIRNCHFTNSTAPCAGGVFVQSQGTNPTFEDCVFSGNTSINSGGALFFTDSSPTLERCLIVGNSSGIRGAAFGCNFSASPTLIDCVIADNDATSGGVIDAQAEATPSLLGCTVFANTAGTFAAITALQSASPTIERCLITQTTGGTAVYCDGASSSATITCTDIYSNSGGDWTGCIAAELGMNGNFSADPELCSSNPVADLNFELQSDSPCAPGNHPDAAACDVVGAAPVGCATTPTAKTSWGALKSTYRPRRSE